MKKGRSSHTSSKKAFGLPKADILRGRTNFERLFDGSATVYTEHSINVRFRFIDGDQDCKMGFIVAKRLGKANRRNRVKRVLKEVYRLNRQPLMDACKTFSAGFHGALTAKSINVDYNTAEQEVTRLIKRLAKQLHTRFDL